MSTVLLLFADVSDIIPKNTYTPLALKFESDRLPSVIRLGKDIEAAAAPGTSAYYYAHCFMPYSRLVNGRPFLAFAI